MVSGRKSPCKAHFQHHAAATLHAQAATATRADATQYELMLAKLAEDRRRLHDIQSLTGKAELKRVLLPEYEAWVAGALTGGGGVQDDVLMTVLVWRIDVGDLASALPIAAYALHHRLSLPDQFQRTLGCLLAEEFADQQLRVQTAQQRMDGESLGKVDELTAGEDMPDEVRAKLKKAIGYALLQTEADLSDMERALDFLRQALSLHEKVGVKKDIERLERDIRKAQEETHSPVEDSTGRN